MANIRKINNEKDIRDAIRRRERLGIEMPHRAMTAPINPSSFLEYYVFQTMGLSPMLFYQTLQNFFYADQNLRDRRQRNIEFLRGRHFNELVWDTELKRYVTQLVYNQRRNIPPLTYNVISKLVRSLEGQFRAINTGNVVVCDSKDDRGAELASVLTKCINRVKDRNRVKSKDALSFKEKTLSGSPVMKCVWGYLDENEKADVKVRNVIRAFVFTNPGIVDYDLDNLHVICEIHNTTLSDIVANFSNGDYDKGVEIRQAYVKYQGSDFMMSAYSSQNNDGTQIRNVTFNHQGVNNSGYRYIETWVEVSDFEATTIDPLDEEPGTRRCHKWIDPEKIKKEIDAENANRMSMGEGVDPGSYLIKFETSFVKRWYVIYYTPWGTILDVRESPFKNAGHPYIITPPDVNGEAWGIVEEVLNAQLGMDRQIRQADAINENAAKGIIFVPDTAIPDEFTPNEYIQEVRRADGAVIYKVREGYEKQMPFQMYANSSNISQNVQQMIQLYSGLLDEISGNYGAAQGRGGGAVSKTASGYAMETQNAGLNVSGIMEEHFSFLVDRDTKILKMIVDGYTKDDYKRIAGVEIDPNELKQFSFIIQQSKGTNSPMYRMQLEEELLRLVEGQLLPLDVFFEVSNNPVMIQAKQKLAEMQRNTQQQGQVQGQPAGVPMPQQPVPSEQPVQEQQMPWYAKLTGV